MDIHVITLTTTSSFLIKLSSKKDTHVEIFTKSKLVEANTREL